MIVIGLMIEIGHQSVFTRKLILDPPFGSTVCHEKGLGILWYPFFYGTVSISFGEYSHKNSTLSYRTVMADNATRPIANADLIDVTINMMWYGTKLV